MKKSPGKNCFKREIDVGYKFTLQIIFRLHAGVYNYSSQVQLASQWLQRLSLRKETKIFFSRLKGKAITVRQPTREDKVCGYSSIIWPKQRYPQKTQVIWAHMRYTCSILEVLFSLNYRWNIAGTNSSDEISGWQSYRKHC